MTWMTDRPRVHAINPSVSRRSSVHWNAAACAPDPYRLRMSKAKPVLCISASAAAPGSCGVSFVAASSSYVARVTLTGALRRSARTPSRRGTRGYAPREGEGRDSRAGLSVRGASDSHELRIDREMRSVARPNGNEQATCDGVLELCGIGVALARQSGG